MAITEVGFELEPSLGGMMNRETAEDILEKLNSSEPSITGARALLQIALDVGLGTTLDNGEPAPFVVVSNHELDLLAEVDGIAAKTPQERIGAVAAKYQIAMISAS